MKKTSPPLSHHFVRGGQLNIHNLRMIKQVVGFSLLLSAFVMGITLGVLSFIPDAHQTQIQTTQIYCELA